MEVLYMKKELLKNRFHSKFNSGKESIDFILTYINSFLFLYLSLHFTSCFSNHFICCQYGHGHEAEHHDQSHQHGKQSFCFHVFSSNFLLFFNPLTNTYKELKNGIEKEYIIEETIDEFLFLCYTISWLNVATHFE